MAVAAATRDRVHRTYAEFVDVAERKRAWNPFADVPWERLTAAPGGEERALCIETFCGVELYVADYASCGLALTRGVSAEAWFQARWAYEESKHALVFREYLLRSGLRTPAAFDDFESRTLARRWTLPFPTVRQMTCYGALQETATYLIYRAARARAVAEHDEVLEHILFFVGRDEAAHRDFYRHCLAFALEDDHDGTLADLARVLAGFRMPATDLIPDYERRRATAGVAIAPTHFFAHGIAPLLRQVGVSRADMARAVRRVRHGEPPSAAAPSR